MTRQMFKIFFSKNVIAIRQHNHLTQQQFANKVHIKRCTVGAIEEGRTMSLDIAYKVAIGFGLSLDELLTKPVKLTPVQ